MTRRSVPALVALVVMAACTSDPASEPGAPRTHVAPIEQVRFGDVASDVGLGFQHGAFRWDVSPDAVAMMGSGVCWIDYDDDGWLDLFAVNSYAEREVARWRDAGGLPRSALFHNEGGTFVDVSAGSGADLDVRGTGCVAADLDLDGRTDLYVTTSTGGALLWNEGGGRFEENGRAAGIAASGWRSGAAVGDVNRDGWPDLFLAGYADLNGPVPDATGGFPTTFLGVRDLLFLSNGRGDDDRVTFREVGRQAGLEVAGFEHGLGAAFADLDGDADLDLYVANDSKPNRLYDNVPWPGGAGADPAGLGFRFEELAGRAGAADPNAGMGVAEGDYDGDGRPDLFVTNARGQVHSVYRGQESESVNPSFEDTRESVGPDLSAGTGWGVSWADLDLDTDLDLLLVNGDIPVTDLEADAEPIQAFGNLRAQGSPGRFADLTDGLGLPAAGPLLARGSAAADFDNDGDVDVAVNSVGGSLVLLENTEAVGNWLEVRLEGFYPGAVITVALPGGARLTREVQAGSSYLSSEDPRPHFGLGLAARADTVTVRWPDGRRTVVRDVAANQVLSVEPPG